MVIFSSEAEFISLMERMDALIEAYAAGSIEFRAFQEELGYLHSYHALDGHESDEEEWALMERHRERLAWIDAVLDAILPASTFYGGAERITTDEASNRVRVLVEERKSRRPNNTVQRTSATPPSLT